MSSTSFLQSASIIPLPSKVGSDEDDVPFHARSESVPSPPPPQPPFKMRGRRNPSGPGMTLVDTKQAAGAKADSFHNLSITPNLVERKMSQQNTAPHKQSVVSCETTADDNDSSSVEQEVDLEGGLENESEEAEDGDAFHEEDGAIEEDDNDSFLSDSHLSSDSEGEHSSDGSSFFSESTKTNDVETIKIAKNQATVVFWSRLVAICCLILLGASLIFAVMQISSNQAEEAFLRDFQMLSQAIGKTWQTRVTALFINMDALAVDVSLATTSMTWPFVTIPEYSAYATSLRNSQPAIISTALVPLVNQSDRIPYELHVIDHGEWINAPLEWQAQYAGEVGDKIDRDGMQRGRRKTSSEVALVNGVADQIYKFDPTSGKDVVDVGPSPFYPIRLIDPLEKIEAINYNIASDPIWQSSVVNAVEKGTAVLGPTGSNVEAFTRTSTQSSLVTLVYPVFDSLPGNGKAVGVLSALLDWIVLMQGISPHQGQAICCVVENSCNQTFTLIVNGDNVSILGEGDLHDQAFRKHSDAYIMSEGLESLQRATVSQISFDEPTPCQYKMTLYPTVASKYTYESDAARKIAIVTGAVFIFVFAVFVVFDCVQERRNRKMKRTAQEARAIVSSLFPANVRDRLFESNREKEKQRRKEIKEEKWRQRREKRKKQKANTKLHDDRPMDIVAKNDTSIPKKRGSGFLSVQTVQQIMIELEDKGGFESDDDDVVLPLSNQNPGVVSHPKHRLKTFLNGNQLSGVSASASSEEAANPIADLFPHTTVLFADIVGFTAWSSEREPEQVFALLQTLYQSFDRLAKKRGVFKVETIGDCYVAVTGLPEPQPDHAVRMTKFARECMGKMVEVTRKLEVSLGPDTGDLCLRCGLNSGPVTAGVLIGEKSRFQLFGDTVNTASRMESTGEPNKIQISASTADLLKEAGKTYWVRPREDLVHAKGKGNIQTFWVLSRNASGNDGQAPTVQSRGNSRQIPSRTQSLMNLERVRGVQRTTSDSQGRVTASMATSQPTDAVDTEREKRLIQWQVEMFTKLLKKIVAARLKDQGCQIDFELTTEEREAEEEISGICLEQLIDPVSGKDLKTRHPSQRSISLKSPASLFKKGNSGHSTTMQPSSKMSNHRASLQSVAQNSISTLLSANSGTVSILESSNGDLSFSSSVNSKIDTETTVTLKEEENDRIVVDEVAEIIALPQFTPEATKAMTNTDNVVLSKHIVSQLQDYIATIAHMYRNNPFHNFEVRQGYMKEKVSLYSDNICLILSLSPPNTHTIFPKHASHVTMSATKLLNRIVVPENIDYDRETNDVFSDLHDYTYGITSDPLTHFAVVFSALIHDVDHYGVPNGQLAKENPEMAALYRDKSIAEQNSVDLAWDLLSDPRYTELRNCIAADKEERKRFRQLVVNSVMATDIFDKDMKELRNARWDKAFHLTATPGVQGELASSNMEENRNMKATIVIEHIIQASDVAHTMQHWHIYTKWNERLFGEMYSAYECGRSEKNPAEGWYKGELWFFDNYVIPLARKLEECNVFGVASDECLNYATANRNEWEAKGEEIVSEMVARYQKKKFFVAGRAKTRAPNRKDIIKPRRRNNVERS
ncbi:family 3 adenylate cyclase [Nitzschia inconspicua]|uniref:Family 3 adenylate cyclase n=1 Tax=Nitzschia inconspicua TaxID=303405 RepID=A0A9K3LIM3_9STRA|nr:family 3 adenylate cyclase [Nitzschia inconspicua]